MKLKTVKLKEIVSMKYGIMPKTSIISENGYPVYSGYGVTGYAKQFLYREPQLIVVARGVGGTGDVKISPENAWITNLSLILELDKEKVDKTYLYYKLKKEPLRKNLNTGAAQAQITIGVLENYKIKIHELAMQKKIALNIASYDDLIEVNHRRIKLLEESARLLFREWFVYFRFPGNKKVKIFNGIPEKWKKTKVKNLGNIITGKTPSKRKSRFFNGDIPFVKIPDMHKSFIIVKTEESLSEVGANSQNKKYLPPWSVLVSCIGTVGVVAMNLLRSQTNQQINSVIPKKDIYRYYSFFCLSRMKLTLEAIGGGSTMANVNKNKFENLNIIIPTDKTLENFDKLVDPVFKQIASLLQQNQKLVQARDLLLPRLMNGTIDVSEFNTKIPEEAEI